MEHAADAACPRFGTFISSMFSAEKFTLSDCTWACDVPCVPSQNSGVSRRTCWCPGIAKHSQRDEQRQRLLLALYVELFWDSRYITRFLPRPLPKRYHLLHMRRSHELLVCTLSWERLGAARCSFSLTSPGYRTMLRQMYRSLQWNKILILRIDAWSLDKRIM